MLCSFFQTPFSLMFYFILQCSSLLDNDLHDDFIEDLKEDYEMIREDHYENLREKKYVSLSDARSRSFKIDWKAGFKPGMRCLLLLYGRLLKFLIMITMNLQTAYIRFSYISLLVPNLIQWNPILNCCY